MDDWLGRFAAALAQGLTTAGASVDLGPNGDEAILDLARRVAHGTERANAPLAAFLVGAYVGLRVAEGTDATAALEEALRVARRLLPAE